MQLFGLTITRQKAAPGLSPVDSRGGWWPIIRESFTGAWQQNVEVKIDSVLSFHAVYACINRIATDVAKLRVKLVEMDRDGIWSETNSPAYSPVLKKPNRFQTRIQFFQQWMISKLIHGNAYILKERDNRNVVVGLYVLDPAGVKPLVAPDGSVFYELRRDELSGIDENSITVPAREIIHDRMNPLFHPLVGVSPIFASGLAATQGLHIQKNSAKFFQNGSKPGGILTAPGAIADETAKRLKEYWEANFTGDNAGRVAVLGDGLKYEAMTIAPDDAQLVEQLKWTAETVCSCFAVPPYKIGVGTMPTQTNIEALNQQYYTECLQIHFEDIELLLDEGLEMEKTNYGTEFDLDDLLRMDTATQYGALEKAKSVLTLDERRRKVGFKPMKTGGSTVYMQQQDHSLEAIAARDKLLIEQATQPAQLPAPAENGSDQTAFDGKAALAEFYRAQASMLDGKALAAGIVETMGEHLATALEPILERLEELEGRAPERGEKGEAGERGADGKDGANGRDGNDGKDGLKGETGEPGADGKAGDPGRDGRDGLAGAAGRDGKDGEAGADGKDGLNGADGKDGADGLGFDDLTVEHDGERGFVLRFARAERVKEFAFSLPVMVYRGVYREGETYVRGDSVTFGGSLWHCDEPSNGKPGDGAKGWTLIAKRGRDGKAGDRGEKGDPGKNGSDGRDLTQLGPDGSRW